MARRSACEAVPVRDTDDERPGESSEAEGVMEPVLEGTLPGVPTGDKTA